MKDLLNILILGSGGRETALAEKLLQSPRCNNLFTQCADIPGATLCSPPENIQELIRFCKDNQIDILIPGSEKYIVDGIADEFADTASSTRIIAPCREAALLEGSKEYAKEFMAETGIPSPRFMPVDADTLEEGLNFLDSLPGPYVLKADGLAEGEGVLIINDLAEAKDDLEDMIRGRFGSASEKVLVEEFVHGDECSIIIATDGEDYVILPTACDYKRRFDNNVGPNTRGMGAYSPAENFDEKFLQKVRKRIIAPTLRELTERGLRYRGFLYFGVMSLEGEPVLIEFNVRLGDPETQAIMPRIKSDFVEILEGIADNTIGLKRIEISDEATAAVVILKDNKRAETIVGKGATPGEAARMAYAEISQLYPAPSRSDKGVDYRTDIALPSNLSDNSESSTSSATEE